MRKTSSLTLITALLASLILAACGGGQPDGTLTPELPQTPTAAAVSLPTPTLEPTEAGLGGTITLWHAWDEAQLPLLLEILHGFQGLYPEVYFDVLYVPVDTLRPRFEAEAAEGGGPDILFGPAAWGPQLHAAGWTADLSSLGGAGLADSLSPPALGAAQYEGALVGLPYALQGVVLYRNSSLVFETPATLEDLIEMAQAATRGDIIGADLERSFFFSGGHLSGMGGEWLGPDGAPAFNNEKGLEWIDLLRLLEQAGPTEFQNDRDLELFKEGRVGWIIDGTWNLAALNEALGPDDLAIDPWPAYRGGSLAGFVQAENLFVSAGVGSEGAANRQAVLEFLRYVLLPETQARLPEIGRLPAAQGVRLEDPLMAQASAALAGGVVYPLQQQIDLYATPLDAALRSVFEGGASPVQALQTAEEAVNQAILNTQSTPTP